ncbi:MAG TPA: DNA repair protein RecO [Rhizomicrobium sp.]|nr:DNA repair protein RecO [Rhizomicrobium sp.]
MEWTDDAIVLSARPHGETSAILEALTRAHGRHLGLVRGGASRKSKSVLQPGNSLHLHWRARLGEHLGNFTVEPAKARAGDMLESREALIGLNAFAAVASAALPEREVHAPVFEAATVLLDAIQVSDFAHWGALYIRWEAGLLEELGFGLDLMRCASTGGTEDLIYVSPKSGRAVSASAGAPYRGRLLVLPPFLLGTQNATPDAADIAAGLKLTEHFLVDRVLAPHDKEMPQARQRLDDLAGRESL